MTVNRNNPDNLPALQAEATPHGDTYLAEVETSLEKPRRIGTLMLLAVFRRLRPLVRACAH